MTKQIQTYNKIFLASLLASILSWAIIPIITNYFKPPVSVACLIIGSNQWVYRNSGRVESNLRCKAVDGNIVVRDVTEKDYKTPYGSTLYFTDSALDNYANHYPGRHATGMILSIVVSVLGLFAAFVVFTHYLFAVFGTATPNKKYE